MNDSKSAPVVEQVVTMKAGEVTIWATAESRGEWRVNSCIAGNKYAAAGQEKESWKAVGKTGGVKIGMMRGLDTEEQKDPMKHLDAMVNDLQKLAASKTPLPNLTGITATNINQPPQQS